MQKTNSTANNFVIALVEPAQTGSNPTARFGRRLDMLATVIRTSIQNFVNTGGFQGSLNINGEKYPFLADSFGRITHMVIPFGGDMANFMRLSEAEASRTAAPSFTPQPLARLPPLVEAPPLFVLYL